ncbi:hypothetical protein [Herbaspirillum sp. alder98]|uniref:hypothetical protein n=1 Tax=Herbaspirillum sp. alder98 TaxID=2913096 RepID=UPI001CD82C8D|nr:hypothetical protein [Herbaspirillum sp. alder98]MCA1325677.1 hypothetical protein [Herbaspirillum sp. alder98]
MRINPGFDPSRTHGLAELMREHDQLLDSYAARPAPPPATSYLDAKATPSATMAPGRRPGWAQPLRSIGRARPSTPSRAALTRVNHAGEQDLAATVFLNGVSGYVPPIPRDDPQEAPLKTEKTRQATVADVARDEQKKAASAQNYAPAASPSSPNSARYQFLLRSRMILNLGLPEIYLGIPVRLA